MTERTYRVTGGDETWEGSLDDLLSGNDDLPELVRRRIETLPVGDAVRFDFDTPCVVERIA